MPAPSLITDLSQTAGSNQPVGSVDTPSTLDDVQRAHASFIAMLRDGVGFTNPATLAGATTTSIGGVSSLCVEITGSGVTITSLGTTYNGPRFLRFQGAHTLDHSSSLNLPGAADITTAAGDTCIAIPNQALSGWNVYAYQRASALPALAGAVTSSNLTQSTARMLGRTTASTGAIEELTAANVAAFISAASDTAQGAVELATTGEVQAGTDTARAVTPAGLQNGKMVSMGQQNATSGSTVTFSSIPSWVRRITVQLDAVSTNGTAAINVQIGSGSLDTTGYTAWAFGGSNGNVITAATSTSGFPVMVAGLASASSALTGVLTLTLMDAATNKWAASGAVSTGNATAGGLSIGGTNVLSGTLDRVALVTSDTFDGSGTINVLYE